MKIESSKSVANRLIDFYLTSSWVENKKEKSFCLSFMRTRMRIEGEKDIRYPQLSWLHNSLSLSLSIIFINIQFILSYFSTLGMLLNCKHCHWLCFAIDGSLAAADRWNDANRILPEDINFKFSETSQSFAKKKNEKKIAEG